MAELLPCPFCGGEGRWNWNKDYILCSSCDIAVRPSIWNTRPAPSPRMADVRLWTWTDESNRNPNVYAVRYCGTEMFTTNSANAAKSRCDELNLAATVTLPAIQKNERSTDAFQCPSCGAAIKAPPRSNEKTLRRYGWHDESCPDYPTRTRPIGLCNCGFLSALAHKEG